ncbi:hypothetical protein ACK3TF_003970 [Chlorella vulgaris]
MGQTVTKQQPHGDRMPKLSAEVRALCRSKHVKRLIKTQQLAPCWTPLKDGQGHECPVCEENYIRLNHTGCCDQEICTECFMTIVASCDEAWCPYCQVEALQVFLPSTSAPASSRATAAANKTANRSELSRQLAASGSLYHDATCVQRLAPAPAAVGTPLGKSSSLCQLACANGPSTSGTAVLPCGSSPAGTPVGSPQYRGLLCSPASCTPVGSPLSHSWGSTPGFAPSTPVAGQRMQAAIARTDASLRQAQPIQRTNSPSARRESEWLQRLSAADAAVRQAMVRVDSQRFDACAASGRSSPQSSVVL